MQVRLRVSASASVCASVKVSLHPGCPPSVCLTLFPGSRTAASAGSPQPVCVCVCVSVCVFGVCVVYELNA